MSLLQPPRRANLNTSGHGIFQLKIFRPLNQLQIPWTVMVAGGFNGFSIFFLIFFRFVSRENSLYFSVKIFCRQIRNHIKKASLLTTCSTEVLVWLYLLLRLLSFTYARTSPKRFFVPINHLIAQVYGIIHPLLIAIPIAESKNHSNY